MKFINSASDLLLQIWNNYFNTMLGFNAAHPILAPIVFVVLLAFMIRFSIILNAKKQKPMREIFNINKIKKQIEKPLWFSEYITILIAHILLFPLYALNYLALGAIKVYFYFVIKKIEYKYRK